MIVNSILKISSKIFKISNKDKNVKKQTVLRENDWAIC